jgi:hypothetical protein
MNSMPFSDRCAIGNSDAGREYSSLVCVGAGLYVGLRLLDPRGAELKSQPVIPKPDIEKPGATMRVPPSPPATDSQVAANDDLSRDEEYEKVPNPLWAINIAMAAFFISAALIMMFS